MHNHPDTVLGYAAAVVLKFVEHHPVQVGLAFVAAVLIAFYLVKKK